jgi:hypothetical protein
MSESAIPDIREIKVRLGAIEIRLWEEELRRIRERLAVVESKLKDLPQQAKQ